MPQLRSSARLASLRSRKLEEQLPAEPPVVKPVSPAPRKRIPIPAVRGRGRRGPPRPAYKFSNFDADPPVEAVPAPTLVSEAKNPASNKVADHSQKKDKVVEGVASKDLRMDGESAEKLVGADDESTTAPIPERVLLLYVICFHECHFQSVYFFDRFCSLTKINASISALTLHMFPRVFLLC